MNASNEGDGLPKAGGSSPRRFKLARGLVPIAAVIAACSTPGSSPKATQGSPGAFQLLVPSARIAIASGFHGAAGPKNDLGRMDGATKLPNLTLRFKLSPEQLTESTALKAAQQDPSSADYHRWLKPEEYAARFGATAGARATVSSWLASQGFDVGDVTRAGTRIHFSGTVAQVEAAFSAEMHRYLVDDEPRFALASPAFVPATIGDLVIGLHGADNFRFHPPPHKFLASPDYTAAEDAGAGKPPTYGYSLTPDDWATIYGTQTLLSAATPLNGTGVTIAIVGQSYYNPSDVAKFRSTFKLPATTIQDTLVPGTGNQFYQIDSMVEAELDLEWSGGVAPGATIDFIYSGDAGSAFDAIFYVADEGTAPIMSASFSLCEPDLATDFGVSGAQLVAEIHELGDQINLEGITFVAASGDTGPAACEENDAESSATGGIAVNFPASMSEVTAVGGTGLSSDGTYWNTTNDANYGSAKAYVPESSWDDTFAVPGKPGILATGGGASAIFTKPVWQTGIAGIPADSHRYLPDIAFSAGGNGISYNEYFSYTAVDGADGGAEDVTGRFIGVVGTSAATPAFAGVLAILNQALIGSGSITTAGLGNVNPQLYALAANATTYASAFHDVTEGNNCVPCTAGTPNCPTHSTPPCTSEGVGEYGFAAGTGYDEVTGLGSLDVAGFVAAWQALIPTTISLAVTPNPGTTGKSVTLAATVTSTNTTAAGMTGTVSFYDQNGDPLVTPVTVTAKKSGAGDNQATASGAVTTLPPGVDTIYAEYTGDKNYLGSFTLAESLVVDDAGDTILSGGTPILIVDAGLDAASFDAAAPGTGSDSGPGTGSDASAGSDGSSGSEDSGSPVASEDSGSPIGTLDSGLPGTGSDSGTPSGGSDDASTGNGSSPGSSSGCSCKTAGTRTSGSSSGALGGILFGLVAVVRRRRSRASAA